LSPIIQNAAFDAAGVDGVYVAVRCDRDRLPALMEAVAQSGGGGNVTLPHKERAAAVVKNPSEAVRRTGACNTFWGERGEIRGDNTDVEGFRRALERFLGRPPRDHRVLVLGAGGAARAVLLALLDEGVKDITLYNRTVERARAVSRRIGGERVRVVSPVEELNGGQFDLIVNSTRLGLDPADPRPARPDAARARRGRAGPGLRRSPDAVRPGGAHVRRARHRRSRDAGAAGRSLVRAVVGKGSPRGRDARRPRGPEGQRRVSARAPFADVLRFLLPARCLGCASPLAMDAAGAFICGACLAALREPPWPRCDRCQFPAGRGARRRPPASSAPRGPRRSPARSRPPSWSPPPTPSCTR
jgi:shikimate dehydrogenase